MDVPGGSIKIKSTWERASLRQEFSSAQRMLLRSWSIGSDDRLVLTQRIQSATFRSKDTQAVFDKQSPK